MVLLLSVVLLLAQAVISVRTEFVAVPVSVTDADGHEVDDLTRDNFRVYEDGRLRTVAVFHHGDTSATVGLVVDRSQSMRPKSAAFTTSLIAILRSTLPGDELFALGVNDRVRPALPVDTPFTSDTAAVYAGLAAMPAEGRTALYDGIIAALERLQQGQAARKVLIVISDGGDNASEATYAQVVELARRSQAVIYAIGLLGTPPVEEEEDAGLISRLCRDSGGVAFFPKSASAIAAASAQVARDIRGQYVLGFTPGPAVAGRPFHKIRVRVEAAGRGRLRVRARSGFFVDP